MSRLRIHHETTYRFPEPVEFGVWRLMVRPTDTHAVRVVEANLTLSPEGNTRWGLDAYGNSVCLFQPTGSASELTIINDLLIERYPAPLNIVWDSTALFDDEESRRLVLTPYWLPATPDEENKTLRAWLETNAPRAGEERIDVLKRLNSLLHETIQYAARESEGVQSPSQTLELGTGACRDVAWLMIETIRRLGYPARFASGYIYSPGANLQGAGATHAWCEVFLGGLGWVEFDPTNGIAESHDLIRVASTRTPAEATPVRGSTATPAQGELTVLVDVQPA